MSTTEQNTTGREWTQEDIDEVTIEASALVYLDWDAEDRRWRVSPATMDNQPLDHHGESLIYTDFGDYDELPPQKQREWDEAAKVNLPTGQELIELLREAE